MDGMELTRSLCVDLPEDILKKKWAGDIDGAQRAIDRRLAGELPRLLRARLLCERERLRRLPLQYPWNREQALERLRGLLPDITAEQLDALEDEGKVDFLWLGGEKRYFLRFHLSLMKLPELQLRAKGRLDPASPWLDPQIAALREAGCLARRITLEASIAPAAGVFVPGVYHAWLPLAAETAQQSDVRVLAGEPDFVAAADAPARTAHWRRRLDEPVPFTLRYSYVSRVRFADPLNRPAPETPLYPDVPAPTPEDTAEDGVFIRFTPLLRSLAAELTEGAESSLERAWRIYRYITQQLRYSFVRQYTQLDSIGEYCALNGRGDCGLQAILFINLCRICGIPARWQSGLSIDSDSVGSHDWAQFWLEGWGWLFADPSFGGGAWRSGAEERWRFYFGNLEPMRMAANRMFMAPLQPAGRMLRLDPFDNQSGELEREGAELPFVGREVDDSVQLVEVEEL